MKDQRILDYPVRTELVVLPGGTRDIPPEIQGLVDLLDAEAQDVLRWLRDCPTVIDLEARDADRLQWLKEHNIEEPPVNVHKALLVLVERGLVFFEHERYTLTALGLEVRAALPLGMRIYEKIGVGAFNPTGLERLTIER